MKKLSKLYPHILSIAIILAVCTAFFYPQLKGLVIQGGDASESYYGHSESREFNEKTGKTYRWNNGKFSGMPVGLLSYGGQYNYTSKLLWAFSLWISPPIGTFIIGMICMYIVLCFLGNSYLLSLLGAISYGIGTNLVILWEAGHQSKVNVLVVLPLMLGGILLCLLKRKYLLGGMLFIVGASLAILLNHIQMVYYFTILTTILVVIYSVFLILKKEWKHLLTSGVVLIGGAILAVGSNAMQLYSSKYFSEDTMRGKSILSSGLADDQVLEASSSHVDGLGWDYAMRWSYDLLDVFAMVIPRMAGGSNAERISSRTTAGKLMRQNNSTPDSKGRYRAPMYWGSQPFVSGPVYLSIVMLLLLVFAAFYLPKVQIYGLFAVLVLGILIAMGHHASWLNRPLFDYLPLFNKFRAPGSEVNVLPVFLYVFTIIGLGNFLNSKVDVKKKIQHLYIAAGSVSGFCFLMALFGTGIFSFTGAADASYQENIRQIWIETRKQIFTQDAWRTFIFALATAGVVWAYIKEKIPNKKVFIGILSVLMLLDFWGINRRIIFSDTFAKPKTYDASLTERPVDKQIKALEPKGRGYYRVLDFSINTFNTNVTTSQHNTIGGYDAAKLVRYQDMIDYYISKGNQGVLNMLNAKYYINRDGQLQINSGALGSAWFVDTIFVANTPNEEIATVGKIDFARQAVVIADEFETLKDFSSNKGSGVIELTEYEPDNLTYKSTCDVDRLAVFSEIWYGPNKGWTVTIDGQPTEMYRANYILRAIKVPAGEHEINFTYQVIEKLPLKYATIISSIIILMGFLGTMSWEGYQWWREEKKSVPVSTIKKRVKKTKLIKK